MKYIEYEDLLEWQKSNKDFQLVDVRDKHEHEEFNIGGINIPLDEILKGSDLLDHSKPIVFYCKMGIRSRVAVQQLLRKDPGAEVYNLNRGTFRAEKHPPVED